uniref:Uncharacterized protein n=1 Tax=Kalanchoe fedtschenkoi TaxID=63787 RepID=A0A7N0TZ15_KALFE
MRATSQEYTQTSKDAPCGEEDKLELDLLFCYSVTPNRRMPGNFGRSEERVSTSIRRVPFTLAILGSAFLTGYQIGRLLENRTGSEVKPVMPLSN